MTTARAAGLFYLGTFLTGFLAFGAGASATAANFLATVCYVGVTVLFYRLFTPVNAPVSLVAAVFSAIGCVLGFLAPFHITIPIGGLPFFGVYCILIGYLIVESTFMPSWLGVALMIGGSSWLTFASHALMIRLRPYNFAPGILAEAALTVWLLAKGRTA